MVGTTLVGGVEGEEPPEPPLPPPPSPPPPPAPPPVGGREEMADAGVEGSAVAWGRDSQYG